MFGQQMLDSMINFSTYPDGIFKGTVKFMLYLVIPVGMSVYQPIHLMVHFQIGRMLAVLGYTVLLAAAAVFVFYRGLKRYSSSSLMSART